MRCKLEKRAILPLSAFVIKVCIQKVIYVGQFQCLCERIFMWVYSCRWKTYARDTVHSTHAFGTHLFLWKTLSKNCPHGEIRKTQRYLIHPCTRCMIGQQTQPIYQFSTLDLSIFQYIFIHEAMHIGPSLCNIKCFYE